MPLSPIPLAFSFCSNSPPHSTFLITKITGIEGVKQATPPFLQKLSELQPSVRTELEEENSPGVESFHLEDCDDWSPWSACLDLESHRNSPLYMSIRVSRKASVKNKSALWMWRHLMGCGASLSTKEKARWAQATLLSALWVHNEITRLMLLWPRLLSHDGLYLLKLSPKMNLPLLNLPLITYIHSRKTSNSYDDLWYFYILK